MSGKKFVFRVARPVQKGDPEYWSTRARVARQLFPSDVLTIPREGNKVEKSGKLVLKTAPHLGKRDIVEYLRKVYGVRVLKVNSFNFDGKLKRSTMKRGVHIYRTKAFKKFYVTVDDATSLLPEQKLNAALEGEVVGAPKKD